MQADQTPIDAIGRRIDALRQQRTEAMQTIREIDLRLNELAFVINALTQKATEAPADQPSSNGQHAGECDELPGATEAILSLVGLHPGRYRQAEVADILKEKIDTTSANPRRLLIQVIENLKRKGRLTQNVTGKLFVPVEPPSQREDGDVSDPAVSAGQQPLIKEKERKDFSDI